MGQDKSVFAGIVSFEIVLRSACGEGIIPVELIVGELVLGDGVGGFRSRIAGEAPNGQVHGRQAPCGGVLSCP